MRQQWGWTGEQRSFFEQTRMPPMVKRLMIATVVVFFLEPVFGARMIEYFALSPDYAVRHLWLWQFVTYLFLHSWSSPFHILFNMLCLYFFARDIEIMLGGRRFLIFYFAAGIFAGIAYCLIHLVRGLDAPVLGASGAIMAVMVAYAISFPERIVIFFIFPMKMRTLILLLIGLDLFYGVQGSPNGVANFAHLGGALFGFLYWKWRPLWERVGDVYRDWRASRRKTVDVEEEDDLDRILEKISQHGMDSLTKRERSFLLRASERRRREKVPPEGHA